MPRIDDSEPNGIVKSPIAPHPSKETPQVIYPAGVALAFELCYRLLEFRMPVAPKPLLAHPADEAHYHVLIFVLSFGN